MTETFHDRMRRLRAEDEQRHVGAGAASIGPLAMVDVGWVVRAREGLKGRVDPDGYPVGGIVVEVHGGGTRADQDTGEVVEIPRRFATIDHESRRARGVIRHTLTETEVDPQLIVYPDSARTRRLLVRLLELGAAIGASGTREGDLLEIVQDLGRLARTLTLTETR